MISYPQPEATGPAISVESQIVAESREESVGVLAEKARMRHEQRRRRFSSAKILVRRFSGDPH
jgi:hypothetical protein